MEPDPKDLDAKLGEESRRLLGEVNALIERGRLLIRERERALAVSVLEMGASSGTLGHVLYAKPPHALVVEGEWVSLVRAIAARDQLALHALYERVRGPVSTLLLRILGDQKAAEQSTLEVMDEVWRQAGDYDAEKSSVVAWIMNVTRATALGGHPAGAPAVVIDTSRAARWSEPEWQDVAPGISVKLLATDSDRHRVSMLVRLVPGGEYPAHTHAGVEELHLLDGELWIDDRKLYPGDYNRAEPGTGDKRVWSETGCTCVLVTSTKDLLR